MSHTPGPWEARDVAGAGWQIYAKVSEWNDKHCSIVRFSPLQNMTLYAKKDGSIVGMMAYEEWVQFQSKIIEEQWAGNAKLAAAAPDLLSVAQFIVQATVGNIPPGIVQAAKDAIKKAEEGTPKPNLSMPEWAE
jgi:hypothetical protein